MRSCVTRSGRSRTARRRRASRSCVRSSTRPARTARELFSSLGAPPRIRRSVGRLVGLCGRAGTRLRAADLVVIVEARLGLDLVVRAFLTGAALRVARAQLELGARACVRAVGDGLPGRLPVDAADLITGAV